MAEKTQAEQLKEELFYAPKHAGLRFDEAYLKEADEFCAGYKRYLDAGKTERECVGEAVRLAEAAGFKPFDPATPYKPGEKLYYVNRLKCVILCVIGTKPLIEGVRIAAAHIDSPRLDLKPNPLYEAEELALLKTHYYGGVKKYQWVAIPLALHGVIIKKDGSKVEVRIGDGADDPCFVITDLLPHLAQEQAKQTMAEGIKGEDLNLLIGSMPFRDDAASERVKLNIMALLHEKYGVVESDFLSAELEIVPAWGARDIGFDRSLIGAYGHDDRVCAYPALMAALDAKNPPHTVLSVLTDKEETGSEGNTGLDSRYLEYFIHALARNMGAAGQDVLSASQCISADVTAAMDPTYPEVLEKRNAARLNYGVGVCKYTGSRGKSGTSDASAEYLARVCALFESAGVQWQMAELGRVDLGGGGTVAKYIARLNVNTLDVGVPVLAMHAPFEIVSKSDVFMMYKACCAFFEG